MCRNNNWCNDNKSGNIVMGKSRNNMIKLILVSATLWISAFNGYSETTDFTSELEAVAALGELTNAPTMRADDTSMATTNINAGELKAIYFDALNYTGATTRVYAYVGIPSGASAANPVPGVVLVHGGGGTAYSEWVIEWANRGYAAISIAVEGQTDVAATQEQKDAGEAVGNWLKHAMAGPARVGIYGDSAVDPITDQWMYHAVADTVLANSLLRSLPEVDASNVGLMGISWGGIITSTAIGIDNRFCFAVPTYGCGHLYDALNTYGDTLGNNDLYKEVWDPMVWMSNATMPTLWFSWPEDWHFPMDCQAYTYHASPATRMVSLVPGMGHGHAAGWNRPESYDFADSVISNGTPWCVQQSINLSAGVASAVFNSTKNLNSASLIYTTGTGKTGDLTWLEQAADSLVEAPSGTWTITATMPADVTGWFINVQAIGSDTNNLYGYVDADIIASSDYQEIIDVDILPAGGFTMEHPIDNTLSTGTVSVAFSVPTNIEITDIQVVSQSHAGAFSSLSSLPAVLYSSPGSLDLEFDNSVASLTLGETATGSLQVSWQNLDGSTDQAQLPVSATITESPTITNVTIEDANIKRPEDRNADGTGDGAGNVDFRLVGYFENTGVGNMHLVWAFPMTGTSRGCEIVDAAFSVTQTQRVGNRYPYDIELHVIRTSPTSDLLNSDYETSAGVIMTNFNTGATSGLKALDDQGKSALTSFLQDNWKEGEYLILGLKTSPITVAAYPQGANMHDYHQYEADAQLTLTINRDVAENEFDYTSIQRVHDSDSDGLGNTAFGAPAHNLVGYYKDASSIGNMHMVWSFQMTGLSDMEQLTCADFSVEQTNLGGSSYSYDIQAHIIRTSPSSQILISDYESSDSLLTSNFDDDRTIGMKSLDSAGKSLLKEYLKNNWKEGEYIFIGLKTDPLTIDTYPNGSNDFYWYNPNAKLTLGVIPLPPVGTMIMLH